MSRGRGLAANLATALVSLLLFGGAAELAARALDLRPALADPRSNPPWLGERWLVPREDYREGLARTGELSRLYDLYTWDRWVFYRLRPDRDLLFSDPLAPPDVQERTRFRVRTNSRGFRTPEFSRRKPPGTTRITALGDSSTFGWGVEAERTYPARLGDALAAWPGLAEPVEVINLGVPGYSTFQGRVLLEKVALPLAPDLALWSYISNDGAPTGESDRRAYAQRSGPTGALLAGLHASRAFETLEAWVSWAQARLRPPAPPDPRDPAARNVRSEQEIERNVREALELAERADVPLVVLALCARGRAARLLSELAAESGAPFVDGMAQLVAAAPRVAQAPEFAEERRRLQDLYGAARLEREPLLHVLLPDGCHPNAVGHALVAEALAPVVARALGADGP